MFRWRKIVTERSCDEILFKLAGMVKDSSFSDYVMENAFSVHVSTQKFRFNGNRNFNFIFNGFVKEENGKIVITYRPTLPKPIMIIFAIILISPFISVLSADWSINSLIVLCVLALFDALFYLILNLCCRQCITMFEARF